MITDVPDDCKIMTEEPFGPVAPIVTFKTFDEVVERANSLRIRACGLRVHHVDEDRDRDRRCAAVRHGRRQQRRDLDARDAVRRHQGIGYGHEGGIEGLEAYMNKKFISQA